MRAAILELAFHGLGADRASSKVLDGAEASLRVAQKLGYVDATARIGSRCAVSAGWIVTCA